MRKNLSITSLALLLLLGVGSLRAQEGGITLPESDEPLSTLFSIKLSGGYGLSRASSLYGMNGTDPVYWSAGQGAKMDLGLVLPLLPVDIMNVDGEEFGEPTRYPVVGLEMEFASGYQISVGGTTNDILPSGALMKTERSYSAVPITLGFNARAALGAGLPSVFIGAGGGLNIKAVYEDHVSFSNTSTTYTRKYDPPIPLVLYAVIGFEIPLLYSPDDGNSAVDLFGQLKLTEGTYYIYDYTVTGSDGSQSVVRAGDDQFLLYTKQDSRSISNASMSLGFKINLY